MKYHHDLKNFVEQYFALLNYVWAKRTKVKEKQKIARLYKNLYPENIQFWQKNHYLFFVLSLSVSLFMQLSKSFIQAQKSRRS